jgi:tetratricopeptide (TPR) repeat protein
MRRLLVDQPEIADHRIRLATYVNALGVLHANAGRLAEARSELERVVDLLKGLSDPPGKRSIRVIMATVHNNLGINYRDSDRPEEAIASFTKACAIQRSVIHEYPENGALQNTLASFLFNLAETHQRDSRQKAEAMATLGRSIAAGYRRFNEMARDPEMSILAARPDFQALLMDSAMPVNPFAQ